MALETPHSSAPDAEAGDSGQIGTEQKDVLGMFFQENFSPENYVNALHSSIIGLDSNKYSSTNLANINSKSQDLITHLEYNTNEMLRELAEKTAQLKRISGSMGHSEGASRDSDHSRLQYYVDALRNSVDTLSGDLNSVCQSLPLQENDHVHSLIQLKTIKANILSVCECLQKTRQMVGGDTVTDRQFAEALQGLHETLRAKSRESEESKEDVSATVAELKSWVPMFQPFSRFGPAYSKFISRLDDI